MQNWIAETISPQVGFAVPFNFCLESYLLLGPDLFLLLALPNSIIMKMRRFT